MSNLLEKASILLTPTAYSDGSLNTVIPPYAPSYINNIPFVTSEWGSLVEGWSIDETNNKLVAEATWTGLHKRAQYIIPEIQVGKTVKFSFDAVVTAGKFHFLSPFSSGDVGYASPDFINQSGSYSFTFVASSSSVYFRNKSTDFAGEITNIRVEVIEEADFDFSRGSSATRVNEKGLIEDVQILSGNLVQNGDFEQIGSEEITNGNFDTDLNGWTNYGGSLITWENGGYAAVSNNSGYWCMIRQNDVFEIDKIYKITMTAKSSLANKNFHGAIFAGQSFSEVDTFQTFTQYFKATGTSLSFGFSNVTGFGEVIMTVDNVSVKEVGQNWTFETGWSIGDGVAIATSAPNGSSLYQNAGLTIGNLYEVTYEIKNFVSGEIVARCGNTFGTFNSSNGVYKEQLICTSGSNIVIRTGSNTTAEVTNISVIEITDDTDIPRIDYTSGQGALLLEPQSTNKITYSETFSTWEDSFVLLTSTNIAAPDGSNSVIKMSSSNLVVREHKVIIDTNLNNATDSIFAKMGEVRYIMSRRKLSSTSWQSVVFDLQEGVIAANNYLSDAYPKITYYGNGWYRCEVYYNGLLDTQTGWGLSNGTDQNFTPTNTTDGLYIWGAQQEDLSFASSYIKTEGSTVTRSADVANNSGNADLFNDSEGVLYAEISGFVNGSGGDRTISISDGSTQNTLQLLLHNTANRINFRLRSGGSLDVNISDFTFEQNEINKIACKYKSGDYALWINGEEKATSTSSSLPSGLSELAFNDGAFNDFYGNVKSVAVFKEALTDFELACLTS